MLTFTPYFLKMPWSSANRGSSCSATGAPYPITTLVDPPDAALDVAADATAELLGDELLLDELPQPTANMPANAPSASILTSRTILSPSPKKLSPAAVPTAKRNAPARDIYRFRRTKS
jgi:hypothetical protein